VASERRGHILKGFKDYPLKAKARLDCLTFAISARQRHPQQLAPGRLWHMHNTRLALSWGGGTVEGWRQGKAVESSEGESHSDAAPPPVTRSELQLISLERYTLSVYRAGEIDLFENLDIVHIRLLVAC